jgi:hypothetical protein
MCEEKECVRCKIVKALIEFDKRKNGVYRNYCRPCGNIMCREYKARNRDKISDYNKSYKKEHSQEISEYNSKYNKEHREEIQTRQTRTQRERKKVDPNFKISGTLRKRLCAVLKSTNSKKCDNTLKLLGCSLGFLKKWFEFLFEEDMAFENHGSLWHIDHVIPCSLFNVSVDEEQKRCFHWTNLQPLRAEINISKNNKLTQEELDLHEERLQCFIECVLDGTEGEYTLIEYDKTQYLN